MADAVATEPGIVVGGVVSNREAVVVAHGARLEAPERQDRVTPSGPDRPEAGRTRAPQECQEQGLGLIIGGVPGQSVGADRCSAGGACACFEVGSVLEVDLDRAEVDVERCCGRPGDVGIDVCRRPKAVVDVDGRDVTPRGNGQRDERGRVGATGESTGDGGAVWREGAPAQEIGGVNQRGALVVGDRYRSVWWAERWPLPGCCRAVTDFR